MRLRRWLIEFMTIGRPQDGRSETASRNSVVLGPLTGSCDGVCSPCLCEKWGRRYPQSDRPAKPQSELDEVARANAAVAVEVECKEVTAEVLAKDDEVVCRDGGVAIDVAKKPVEHETVI